MFIHQCFERVKVTFDHTTVVFQIELGSVEENERSIPRPRVKRVRPLIDPVCALSTDTLRRQNDDYSDTMRAQVIASNYYMCD